MDRTERVTLEQRAAERYQFDEQARAIDREVDAIQPPPADLDEAVTRIVAAILRQAAANALALLTSEPRADVAGEFTAAEIEEIARAGWTAFAADYRRTSRRDPEPFGPAWIVRARLILAGRPASEDPSDDCSPDHEWSDTLAKAVRAKAAEIRARKAPVEPATFPREPRDEEEREACANVNGPWCEEDRASNLCCLAPKHAGDHVSANARLVLARWPQSPAPEPAPAPDVAHTGDLTANIIAAATALREGRTPRDLAPFLDRVVVEIDRLARALADEKAAHAETRAAVAAEANDAQSMVTDVQRDHERWRVRAAEREAQLQQKLDELRAAVGMIHEHDLEATARMEKAEAALATRDAELDRLRREREELADLLTDMAQSDCNCGDCYMCKARRYVDHDCHDGDCEACRAHDCHSSMCKEQQPFVLRGARAELAQARADLDFERLNIAPVVGSALRVLGYDEAKAQAMTTAGILGDAVEALWKARSALAIARDNLDVITRDKDERIAAMKQQRDEARDDLARAAGERAEAMKRERERCIAVARGCTDYGGGYRSEPEKLAAFHHGMETVANALAADPTELQVRVLESVGASPPAAPTGEETQS